MSDQYQVIVIGAGAAGLECCRSLLHDHGVPAHQLLLLEARDRLGGRIFTEEHSTTAPDGSQCTVTLDAGAAWVHGCHPDNPMLPLLQPGVCAVAEANPWTEPSAAVLAAYLDGEPVPREELDAGIAEHKRHMQAVCRCAAGCAVLRAAAWCRGFTASSGARSCGITSHCRMQWTCVQGSAPRCVLLGEAHSGAGGGHVL